jgi:hypothetical protein
VPTAEGIDRSIHLLWKFPVMHHSIFKSPSKLRPKCYDASVCGSRRSLNELEILSHNLGTEVGDRFQALLRIGRDDREDIYGDKAACTRTAGNSSHGPKGICPLRLTWEVPRIQKEPRNGGANSPANLQPKLQPATSGVEDRLTSERHRPAIQTSTRVEVKLRVRIA